MRRKCRKCGCTQFNACVSKEDGFMTCYWVEKDLCSACVTPTIRKRWHLPRLASRPIPKEAA